MNQQEQQQQHQKKKQGIESNSPVDPSLSSKKSYLGILALILGPPPPSQPPSPEQQQHKQQLLSEPSSPRHQLGYHPYNATHTQKQYAKKYSLSSKRRHKKDDDLEKGNNRKMKHWNPHESEFTVLYFCDFHCRNSIRFLPILGHFFQTQSSPKTCQLICVPNNDLSYYNEDDYGFFPKLQTQTEFWSLGYNHCNRLPLIRLLSVSKVPTVIIINNQTGRMISNCGMESIEYYHRPAPKDDNDYNPLFEEWRKGNCGIPSSMMYHILSCLIS